MSDYIECKYPLPLAGANAREYQTKSMDCEGLDYEIREDGTLWVDRFETGMIKPPFGDPYLGSVHIGWVQLSDFNGDVTFYTTLPPPPSQSGFRKWSDWGWLEWRATFVDGKVTNVQLVENAGG